MTDFNTPEPKVKDPENICPKLDNYKPLIDEWLAGDKKAPRKQRHTAKRVFHRLRKEAVGFDCSYKLVAQYVAYRKSQLHLDNRKGYLPLIHHPREGQADFGAAQFYENSRCHDGKYLVLSFPYSNGGYPQLMYGANAECFMESMIAIFDHIGGVPTEIWFDNTSTIVTRILKLGDLITPPKTSNGIRKITMPSGVMKELSDYCNRIYGLSPNDRIFTFTKSLIRGNMKRCAAAAGVPFIRIHDLRHSHVSLLIDMGFSAHLIAERIGDTVQMVNNTYGHLYPTKHQEVADRLDQLLK